MRLHSTFAKVKGKSSCNASSIARRSKYLPAYQWRWNYCAAFGTMPAKSNNAYRHLNHRQWNFGHFFVLRLVKVSVCKKTVGKSRFYGSSAWKKNLKFRNLNGTPNKPLCYTPSTSMQFWCYLFIKGIGCNHLFVSVNNNIRIVWHFQEIFRECILPRNLLFFLPKKCGCWNRFAYWVWPLKTPRKKFLDCFLFKSIFYLTWTFSKFHLNCDRKLCKFASKQCQIYIHVPSVKSLLRVFVFDVGVYKVSRLSE